MSQTFHFLKGNSPLLISVPHDGRKMPEGVAARMTAVGRDLPDTDWHVAKLYEFAAGMGASMLVADYSRYVVDLNRPPDDAALYAGQLATGICPEHSFAGEALYRNGARVDAAERSERIAAYWQPYHDWLETTLTALREKYGYALLWDAHSIPGVVPRLFDGELPLLNIGTNDGASCAPRLANAVFDMAAASDYSAVMNARFKGGYITRHFGRPDEQQHAIQLEIAQRAYMDESSRAFDDAKAAALRATLSKMLAAFQDGAKRE